MRLTAPWQGLLTRPPCSHLVRRPAHAQRCRRAQSTPPRIRGDHLATSRPPSASHPPPSPLLAARPEGALRAQPHPRRPPPRAVFFTTPPPTEPYTLSLHGALPI